MTQRAKVVGAGITGATIARLLADKGYQVEVYENNEIGGTCSDKMLPGGTYYQKHGSHIFHTNYKEVWDFLSKYTRWKPYQHKVLSLICGRLVPMPFNRKTIEILFKDNVKDYEYLMEKLQELGTKEYTFDELEKTFEDTAFSEFHNMIFDLAFRYYSEKQWGKQPDKEVFNRVKAFRNNYEDRYFTDVYQGIPVLGFSELIRKMLTSDNIIIKREKFVEQMIPGTYSIPVFFTGALDELCNYKLGELPYRTCDFDEYMIYGHKVLENAVINYPEPTYQFTRVHDYSYYLEGDGPRTMVAYEYPRQFDKRRDTCIKRYYPIKEDDNLKLHQAYVDLLREKYPHLIPVGRLGKYKYFNIDQAVKDAMEIAKKY